VSLTAAGRRLEAELLPVAAEVVNTAVAGFSERDVARLLKFLSLIQRNLARATADRPGGAVDEPFL
jgi:DNA-binding MarR family transcriptional regulator